MDENVSTTTESSSSSMQDYYNLIKAEHEANNAWSAEQALKAMDYQTEMSNTAHQREVADLKAAGLNPVLSAGGSGATTGSGLAAQRSDENVQALYGLTKQAIENTTEIAKAMANSAKYVSGSAGYSSAYDSGVFTNIDNAIADFIYRKFGIKQEHSLALFKDLENLGSKIFGSNLGANVSGLTDSLKDSLSTIVKLAGASGLLPKAGTVYSPKNTRNTHYVYTNDGYYKTGSGRTVHVTGKAKGLNFAKSILKNAIKRALS